MREIKFRAWDLEEKHMYECVSVACTRENKWISMIVAKNGFIDAIQNEHILMQYTGLKDKNGKEIFEGDLVVGSKTWCDGYLSKKYPKIINVICEIRFDGGKFYSHELCATKEHKEAYENNTYRERNYTLEPFPTTKTVNNRLEVIGNIYESPELINI
jgi:uncharacterized phage protein (TIGR01671 family)